MSSWGYLHWRRLHLGQLNLEPVGQFDRDHMRFGHDRSQFRQVAHLLLLLLLGGLGELEHQLARQVLLVHALAFAGPQVVVKEALEVSLTLALVGALVVVGLWR